MKLAPVRTVAPNVPLVTTAEAKLRCRIDGSDEDNLIDSLISAATAHLDGYSGILGRALLAQTWQQDFCDFDDPLRLPVGDYLSGLVVTYYDSANDQQTLSSDVYSILSDVRGPFIALNYNQAWPSVYTREDAVRVTWVAGYGTTAADVPAPIKQAILLLVGHWYANREAVTVGAGITTAELPIAVKALVSPFSRIPL